MNGGPSVGFCPAAEIRHLPAAGLSIRAVGGLLPSDYERIGGGRAVLEIMEDFVGQVFDDFVIGFLFIGRNQKRIVALETELATAHLGGPSTYSGRPMGEVHQPLKINRGQFRRRNAILQKILVKHGVEQAVVARWIAHDAKLESVISDGTDCVADHGGS